MLKTRQIAARTAAALVVVGGLVAVAAAPGGSQTIEVGEVRGDAYGLFIDLTSDLGEDDVETLPVADLVEAANAGNLEEVNSLLAGTGIDFEAEATSPEPSLALEIGPIPQVTLPPDGTPQTDSLANFSLLGLVGFELAEVATEGHFGPDGFVVSTADIENYFLFGGLLSFAEAINVACEADLDGVSGSTAIVDGGIPILGITYPTTPGPNTNLIDLDFPIGPLDLVFNVTFNEQVADEDDISVDGIHTFLSLVLNTDGGPVNLITIDKIVAHTSCGVSPVEIPGPPPVPLTPRFAG